MLALKSFPSFSPTSLEDVTDKNGKWAGKSDSIPDTALGLGIEWLGLDTGLYYKTFLTVAISTETFYSCVYL